MTPPWQKILLFSSLAGGVIFVGVGGASALLHLFDNQIRQVTVDADIKDLGENKKIDWLIRLIPYNPGKERFLSISDLKNLGPPQLKYVFVAPYAELKGYKVAQAVTMLGGTVDPEDRVSAIIFRARHIYPANARGLMQVVQKLEQSVVPAAGKRLIDKSTFNEVENQNLLEDDAIVSWSWDSYRSYYENFCKVAQTFRCDPTYTSRDLISAINPDWHPLGFSRIKKTNVCENKFAICKNKDWAENAKEIKSEFGSRIFLVDNLEIKELGTRYLIDFDKPDSQVIPEIGPP